VGSLGGNLHPGGAALLLTALTAVEWDLTSLTDSAQRRLALGRMGAWLAAFANPDFSAKFLRHGWALTFQTLSAAVIGTFLAIIAAVLLALGSSRAVSVGEENLSGWRRDFPLRRPAALFCSLCRIIQDILRAVPDFVWAVILVAIIGLGPLTGALALALNITGILAKVYSELWDSVFCSRAACFGLVALPVTWRISRLLRFFSGQPLV